MAKIIKAPFNFTPLEKTSVFLAGSIEMGAAENWQQTLEKSLKHLDIVILNPRREDWDSSWIQSINNPQFREQVEWELLAQESADIIVMYFSPGTKSPITLLEFGLFVRSDKLIVCCPKGFWRKGNVDIVCKYYGIKRADTLVELTDGVVNRVDGILK
ncbi:unnamed protein product [marine sediment metagenome]|uniref:Nucleoside 2-deoxyribosyltransferase like n=1 Tax=marine sediment metagenome TaxID=412755 RepID=X1F2F2_9ZZZZ